MRAVIFMIPGPSHALPSSSSSLYIWNLLLPGKLIYQVTIDLWWTKYRGELEDEGYGSWAADAFFPPSHPVKK